MVVSLWVHRRQEKCYKPDVFVALLSRALGRLSTPALLRLGAILGWVWYRVIPLRRREAREAVARAFPERSEAERERIVSQNFKHLVQALLETVAFLAWDDARLQRTVRFEGLHDAVTGALSRGHGSLVLSAHLGSFELSMGSYGVFSKLPIVIVARVPKAGYARDMLDAVRAKTGIEVLPPKRSLPRLIKRLSDDRVVLGFVVDQNMPRKQGVFVEFLGKWCCTTPGFSIIARRSGAEIIPGYNQRLPDGSHLGRFGPAVAPDPHPHKRVAILNDTWNMTLRTEEWIRRAPEQWFWVHRRWKVQPLPGDVVRTKRGLEIAREGGVSRGRVGALLDRDGTINMEIGRALQAPEEVRLVPGAAEAIRRLNGAGIPVVVVSNQAGIGRGTITLPTLDAIHARMRELLAVEGASIDAIYYCPHHPTEAKGEFLKDCDCRKPKPGLPLRAAAEHGLDLQASLFVGDRSADVAAARSAGMRGVAVSNGWAHEPWQPVEADEVCADLIAAVDGFLDRTFGGSGA